MIAVLSPAKTLDYDTPLPPVEATEPRFADEAASLARSAARLPQKRLRELMHISAPLAKLNAERFRDFAEAPQRPAIYAFAGDVYTGFDAHGLDEGQIAFAQDHVRLLSGLYGLLRPLDAIRPYRLEMGTRWAPRSRKSRGAKLTDWWQGRIAGLLAEDVEHEGSGTIVNIASQEYWAAVDRRLPASIRVIEVDFREGDDRRFISFHAKRARGMIARWIAEHRLTKPDDLRAFDSAGYAFDAEASDCDRWTFTRA